MNTDNFVVPNFVPIEQKKDKKYGLNTLLKLSELEKQRTIAGEKSKQAREEMVKQNTKVRELSEQIFKMLREIK